VTEPLFTGLWVAEGCGGCTDDACRQACCVQQKTYPEAEAICAADNARLCTRAEIEGSCQADNGCGFMNVWTSTGCAVGDTSAEAQRFATKLILGTAEFRTQSDNRMKTAVRPAAPEIVSQGRQYKALVFIFMDGGADSANLLAPLDGCTAPLSFEHYTEQRGPHMAMPRNQMLPITPPAGAACATFGITHKMPGLAQMFTDGDASFMANMGNIIEPLTVEEYKTKSKQIPKGLFGHNTQVGFRPGPARPGPAQPGQPTRRSGMAA
jgi:hypothetical protein